MSLRQIELFFVIYVANGNYAHGKSAMVKKWVFSHLYLPYIPNFFKLKSSAWKKSDLPLALPQDK